MKPFLSHTLLSVLSCITFKNRKRSLYSKHCFYYDCYSVQRLAKLRESSTVSCSASGTAQKNPLATLVETNPGHQSWRSARGLLVPIVSETKDIKLFYYNINKVSYIYQKNGKDFLTGYGTEGKVNMLSRQRPRNLKTLWFIQQILNTPVRSTLHTLKPHNFLIEHSNVLL